MMNRPMEVFVVFDTMGDARVLGVFDNSAAANAVARRDAHYFKVQRCVLNAVDEEALAWSRGATVPPRSRSGGPGTELFSGAELFTAAWNGDARAIEACLSAGVDPRSQRDALTALHLAAAAGRADVVVRLLDAGADPDAEAWDRAAEEEPLWAMIARRARQKFSRSLGCTPLHLACDAGHKEIVRLLIQRGADPRLFVVLDGGADGSFAWTPRELACPPSEHVSIERQAIAQLIDAHLAKHPETERSRARQKRRVDASW